MPEISRGVDWTNGAHGQLPRHERRFVAPTGLAELAMKENVEWRRRIVRDDFETPFSCL
jgi:hypothetical protein